MFRVSYISWLVRFPLIRRVHLYLLLSYHYRNISPLFSQSFILVLFLFLVHWCSLHYHPHFSSTLIIFSSPPLPLLSLFHSHVPSTNSTPLRFTLISLFSSIFRSYKRPACFLPRLLPLIFSRAVPSCQSAIFISPFLSFYRRPFHLYNCRSIFLPLYRSFLFPSRPPSLYPSHLFLFHPPSSVSAPRSPLYLRYSRYPVCSSFECMAYHLGMGKAFTGKQHVGQQKLRFISLIQSILPCLEMHGLLK